MTSLRRRLFAFAAPALVVAVASVAAALPPVGSVPGNFTAHDPEDRPVTLYAFRGRPTVLFYEDKDARDQNAALEERLFALIEAGALARRVTFFGVADVAAYDFWPARGFVKDELRAQRARYGLPVYADRAGDRRATLGARPGRSTVVVLDEAGRVLWSSEGELAPGRERAFFTLIKGVAASRAGERPGGDEPGPG